MTHQEVMSMLKETHLQYAYDHFIEGEAPEPPSLVFLYPRSNNFAADGRVYFKVNALNIELYSDNKDIELEENVEAVLDKHGLYYSKSEIWIETENLYEVLYQMEV